MGWPKRGEWGSCDFVLRLTQVFYRVFGVFAWVFDVFFEKYYFSYEVLKQICKQFLRVRLTGFAVWVTVWGFWGFLWYLGVRSV